LFVTASVEVRARRRLAELERRGAAAHYDDVLIDIRARDERDAGRAAAPLRQADDAELLDTSEMGIDAAIARAIELVEAKLATA
jgi:cytidylate kinase